MNLCNLSSEISLSDSGIWVVKGHRDFGYLKDDATNWIEIEDASFWYRHRAKVFASIVRRYHQAGFIFEVGAGNGAVSMVLQNAGFDVVAMEPTLACAQNARNRGVRNVICASLDNVGIPDGSLANVGLFDVLEHIDDHDEFMAQLRNLMRNHGLIFIAVPAYDWLWSTEDEYAGHRRRYTLSHLRRLVERSGFRVEFGSYYFRPLVAPVLMLRTIPSLIRLRRTRTAQGSVREHCLGTGLVSTVLDAMLAKEAATLEGGGRYSFGASLLLVARAE